MMPYCWEGNRRSSVTLAMHHKLKVVYPPMSPTSIKGDEQFIQFVISCNNSQPHSLNYVPVRDFTQF